MVAKAIARVASKVKVKPKVNEIERAAMTGGGKTASKLSKDYGTAKKELAKNFKVLSATKSWKAVDRHNSEKQVSFIKNSVKNYKFIDL